MSVSERLAEQGIRVKPMGHGSTKIVCPQCSGTRKNKSDPCLSVTFDDEGATWLCHHCDWRGGISNRDQDEPAQRLAPKARPKPPAIGPISIEHAKWFHGRGIELTTLQRASVGSGRHWMPGPGTECPVIVFPYLAVTGGAVVNAKFRTLDKQFAQIKDGEKHFWLVDKLDLDLGDACLITEGEIDALSLMEADFGNVISVPDGAPKEAKDGEVNPVDDKKFSFVWEDKAALDPFKKIILAVDGDGPGHALAEELARRLGRDRCWTVAWPDGCKDASDVLMKHGKLALQDVIDRAKPHPIKSLIDAGSMENDVVQLYRRGRPSGLSTGWRGVDELYTVAPGQLTIVTGIPNAGKSEWIDALMVNLAESHQWSFAICSFENPPEEHVTKLVEKHMRLPFWPGPSQRMSEAELKFGVHWVDQHFHFIRGGDDDTPTIDWILEIAKAAVMRHGIRGLVIDPYNEIEHKRTAGMTETEYVSLTLGKVKRFAQAHGVHVWFVAHPAKMLRDKDGSIPVPTLYEISGCHSADTEVLTMRGWLTHDELTLDDRVACFDPGTSEIEYAKPSRIIRKAYSGEMLRFSGYGYDQLVTPDHRMLLKPRWKDPVGTQQRDGIGRPTVWPKGEWSFCEAKDIPRAAFFIPLAGPLREEGGATLSENMAKLAGWYVSEGCPASSGVSISQAADTDGARAIESLLDEIGIPYHVTRSGPGGKGGKLPGNAYYVGVRGARDVVAWLRSSCGEGSANVHMPDAVRFGTAAVKRAFLSSYLAGDGHLRANNTYSATTTSPILRDQLQAVAIELGFTCCWHVRKRQAETHARSFMLSFGRTGRNQTNLDGVRNRTTERYFGDVWCLTVPTGAYVTRRNGKASVSGNSANFVNKADVGIVIHRNPGDRLAPTQVHVKKVRFKWVGRQGNVDLNYDRATGVYSDVG